MDVKQRSDPATEVADALERISNWCIPNHVTIKDQPLMDTVAHALARWDSNRHLYRWLAPYISDEDVTLDQTLFLTYVADRIRDDFGEPTDGEKPAAEKPVAPTETPRERELAGMLEEALEFIEDYEDVVDGDYGAPAPNKAMQLAQNVREVLGIAVHP